MSMESEVHRPLADYSANIWEDLLTHFSKSELECTATLKEKHSTLKEVVKESFMVSKVKPMESLMFIDALCRLGVSYHFEIDIIQQLGNLFDNPDFNPLIRHDECDLYTVGVIFQVFRQFGFKLSADVFEKFKGEDGKFKEHLVADASGILSLYEASQWNTHGEDIMDEALAFSSCHLKEISFQSIPQHLAVRIKNALKHPYHKGISRIETRSYISYYEAEEKRDAVLLEFAKVDFNMLQRLHRTELACVTRWYNEMEIKSKVTYTRHRIVEAYLWSIGAYFEPQYSQARVKFAIALIIFTLLDDTYDAYGTMEELEIFTDAMEKWLPAPPNMIPESMKYVYRITVDFYDKLEEELENEGRSGCGFHLKKALKTTANGYMREAKWLKEDYTATFDEYKENALLSSGYYPLIAMTFAGMGDVANLDAFEWLSSNPKIRVASEIIGRYTDDISSYDFERTREHVATGIDCYMKQFGVSKEQAVEGINIMLSDAWKDMNQELMRPHSCPFPLLMRIFNLSRVIDVFYRYKDCYTHPEFLKEHIVSLFIEDIPI
ncbi:Alpha-humulene/(-)-(E)-beta-caryophyllene synthase [Raphanus sativus]|uniref:Alpha-humulene/(-)-(E)-beta-caryophyllene synthase-like n=1 Tax=Raphanus sativus TaxID=3726 RepID=A0A9W3CZG9_RAPSA|nr:alpha-humulene/(-)-(E)-beta-caryophyllene synthase-like [Raphanus sativus]KAJ4866994.1 Alpha-humulene/(-)-(E)-beta-caryophyllene synthase [Raphanus sativus]